jgi:hypothetical protein
LRRLRSSPWSVRRAPITTTISTTLHGEGGARAAARFW